MMMMMTMYNYVRIYTVCHYTNTRGGITGFLTSVVYIAATIRRKN